MYDSRESDLAEKKKGKAYVIGGHGNSTDFENWRKRSELPVTGRTTDNPTRIFVG